MDLTFNTAPTESVTIVIIDDAISEGTETFSVHLSMNEAETLFNGTVNLATVYATVSIVDQDGM
jgi:hypothetical protein